MSRINRIQRLGRLCWRVQTKAMLYTSPSTKFKEIYTFFREMHYASYL